MENNTPMNFDPMTGQPLTQEGEKIARENQIVTRYEPPKKKTGIIVAIVIGIAVILGIASVLIYLLLFSNPKKVIAEAIAETAEDFSENTELVKLFDIEDISESDENTLVVDLDTEISSVGDLSIYAEGAVDKGKGVMQVDGSINISYIPPIEYCVQIDSERVNIYVPLIDKYLFVYNYKQPNNGYIFEEMDMDSEELNSICEAYYKLISSEKSKNPDKDYEKILTDFYKDMEFKKIEKRELTVDGEDVNCNTYRAIVTKESLNKLVDDFEYVVGASIDDVALLQENNIIDAFNTYRNLIDSLSEDVYIDFSVYKDKLAAVVMTIEDSELEILFEGGDFRTQNVSINVDHEKCLSLKGKKDENSEEYTLELPDLEPFMIEYDINESEVSFSMEDVEICFGVERTDDSLEIVLDTLDFGDSYIGGKIEYKKGAVIKDLEGEEFDIGNASEAEFEELAEDLVSVVSGLMGF